MKLKEAKEKQRVKYVPKQENGTVSSKNEKFIFVKFDYHVEILGFEGTTSMACNPEDLKLI